jgi:hypothetical protein
MRVLVALVCFAILMLGVDGKGKGKSKAQNKLKCSACIAVADEMRAEVYDEWNKQPGATILIEKVCLHFVVLARLGKF